VSDLVTLRHPSLPPEQVIRVDRRRIGPRLAAGWEEVPDLPKAAKSVSVKPPAEPESSKRRSRNNTEEQ
jgi:hypothetical protein